LLRKSLPRILQAAAAEDDASGISLGRRAGVRNTDYYASRELVPIGDACQIRYSLWPLMLAVAAVW